MPSAIFGIRKLESASIDLAARSMRRTCHLSSEGNSLLSFTSRRRAVAHLLRFHGSPPFQHSAVNPRARENQPGHGKKGLPVPVPPALLPVRTTNDPLHRAPSQSQAKTSHGT